MRGKFFGQIHNPASDSDLDKRRKALKQFNVEGSVIYASTQAIIKEKDETRGSVIIKVGKITKMVNPLQLAKA